MKIILRRAKTSAFTLIEILIVIIIITALASMVIPRFSGRSEMAKKAIAEADIRSNIGTALRMYESENGNYPTTAQGLQALMTKPASAPIPQNWNGPYLENDPVDPWKKAYGYKCPGVHNPISYDLYSLGKDGNEGTEDDIGNWK